MSQWCGIDWVLAGDVRTHISEGLIDAHENSCGHDSRQSGQEPLKIRDLQDRRISLALIVTTFPVQTSSTSNCLSWLQSWT